MVNTEHYFSGKKKQVAVACGGFLNTVKAKNQLPNRRTLVGRSVVLILIVLVSCTGTIPLQLPPARQDIYVDAWQQLGGNPAHTHAFHSNIKPPLEVAWKRTIRSVIADHPLTIGPYILNFTWKGNLEVVHVESGDLLSVERIGPALDHVPAMQYPDVFLGLTMGTHNLKRYDLRVAKTIYQVKMTNITTAMLLLNHQLYFGTHTGKVVCAKAATGDSIWQFNAGAPVYASPALGDSLIITGNEKGVLFALAPKTGQVIWKRQLQGNLYAHPVTDSSTAYIGTTEGIFYGIDLQSGDIRWQRALGAAIYDGASLYKTTLYVGTNGRQVIAINARTGHVQWATQFKGIVNVTPLATPDFVYVGCWDHFLYVLDRYTGKIIEKHDVKAPIKTAPIIYRKKLLVHAANETLWAFTSRDFAFQSRSLPTKQKKKDAM